MWHASASSPFGPGTAWAMAERELEALGDPALGEWREPGNGGVVHIRRRLTDEEAARVGEVRDIRGTDEEARRFARLFKAAPQLRAVLGA